ncbi:hypothetical protein [Nocardioides sp. TF02-7]|nr:hypothetical protein [Nocardioides sp. TF02-7]UMG93513.1 hypothetical protein MF408_04680 [Nocardioides sp. TF02-7]
MAGGEDDDRAARHQLGVHQSGGCVVTVEDVDEAEVEGGLGQRLVDLG